MEDVSERRALSLYELNSLIKSVLSSSLPETCWVIAEIAECKINQKGHCYLDLVEKEDSRTVAQIKATIWAYEYRTIGDKFEKATGESLKRGMKVLLLSSVNFHEVFGLSLSVRDIDPSYTLGEMARKKKEVIARLTKEGIIDRNKGLPLPLVPQRIAVISSPTAAGYGDFFNQLDHNPYGYKFSHVLFPAMMQGNEAEDSIVSALNGIKKESHLFDILVIIRGGGSVVDLNCFDGYPVARAIAESPLAVVTGIGHEKDDTVADMVAHTRMKTPTAVAEFLISGCRTFEENILVINKRIHLFTEKRLKDERYRLDSLIRGLDFVPSRLVSDHRYGVFTLQKALLSEIRQRFAREDSGLTGLEQAVRHLDPENVLRRGYSITRHKGKVLKDSSAVKKWAVIESRLHKGTVISIVQEKKEETHRGQSQADNILPGFE